MYKFNKITVMIVEEVQEMFDLTRSVLQTFGINHIISANTVASAYRKFCNYNPDLIILDWLEEEKQSSDEVSSIKLLKKIRLDSASPNPFVPIIVMTGYSIKKNVELARDNGATEFIAKPYTAKILYQKIENIIENPRVFIKSDNFFGPDRRRKDEPFKGSDKRKKIKAKLKTETSNVGFDIGFDIGFSSSKR